MQEESGTLCLDERKDFGFYLDLTGSPGRASYRQVFLDHLIHDTGPWIVLDYDPESRIRGIEILGEDEDGTGEDESVTEVLHHRFDESGPGSFHLLFTGHLTAHSLIHRTVNLRETHADHLGPPDRL